MKKNNINEVIFNTEDIITIDNKSLKLLKQKAINSPYKKARLCLHKDVKELVHEMIIAICQDAYVRPHKHTKKTESFHIIEGSFIIVIFDDDGNIIEKIKMDEKNKVLSRLEKDLWHTIIPLSDFVIFHETTNGPYTEKHNSICASWAPEIEDQVGIKNFTDNILRDK